MGHDHRHAPGGGNGMKSRTRWVLAGFLAIAAYFLITEHKAHLSGLLSYLPILLLLACPLMHLFHHRGHGGHGDDSGPRSDKPSKGKQQ